MNIDSANALIEGAIVFAKDDANIPYNSFVALLITLREAQRRLQPYELPEMKTCVDITAEKLKRYVEGQAPWDPRGELMFFKHKETPDHVMWLSRYRIGIHALSVDGVGVTKGDKYRLSLRNRHQGRKQHRRWNASKATEANSKA